MIHHHEPVFVEQLWRDDYVGDPGFIFHGQEHKTFGSARALSDYHPTGNADQTAMAQRRHINRAADPELVQLCPVVSNGVPADR